MSLFGMHADRGREPQGPIVSFVLTVRIEAPRHPAVNPEGPGPSFETCNRRLSVVASGNPHFVLARDQEPGWVANQTVFGRESGPHAILFRDDVALDGELPARSIRRLSEECEAFEGQDSGGTDVDSEHLLGVGYDEVFVFGFYQMT